MTLSLPGLTRGSMTRFGNSNRFMDPRVKPGGDGGKCRGADDYLIACGLIGEPVPPVMISGGPQKKNS